jgi:hypothetical protein
MTEKQNKPTLATIKLFENVAFYLDGLAEKIDGIDIGEFSKTVSPLLDWNSQIRSQLRDIQVWLRLKMPNMVTLVDNDIDILITGTMNTIKDDFEYPGISFPSNRITIKQKIEELAKTFRQIIQENGGEEKNWHNMDFSQVTWNGKKYKFNKPQQALSVMYLWENKSGREKSIGEAIGSDAENFRLIHVFRQKDETMHPAWGKMIIPDGKGIFTLSESNKKPK